MANAGRSQGEPRAPAFGDVVVVLMAGGVGMRLWPLSEPSRPKQFLTTLTGTSLYAQAAERGRLLVAWDRILVMTNGAFARLVRTQTPDVPTENVILEPCRRDTAAAILLAAVVAERRFPGGVMVVTPSDHLVTDLEAFRQTLGRAVARARRGGLGTIGVTPDFPATAYGYLRVGGPPAGAEAVAVEKFVEKPQQADAEKYLASGRHLWNAGIFVWQTRELLAAAARHLPEMHAALAAVGPAVGTPDFDARVRDAFEQIRPISIDYGIMEKAEDVWCVPATFDWSDLGDWSSITQVIPPDEQGNRVRGATVLEEAAGNVVVTDPDHPVAVVGLSDCIIIHGPCGTLVCHKRLAGRIKAVVQRIGGAT
jgi:mannose-1-phosphate guanylyltransferase